MKRFCVLVVAQPAYTTTHPRLLFDEAHHNHHLASTSYHPFAKLMENDGYRVIPLRKDVTPHNLADAAVLVVVTAMGRDDAGMTVPFNAAECDAIEAWVCGGGSLLVVTDHFPFGQDVANLTHRFGVESNGAMTHSSCSRARTVCSPINQVEYGDPQPARGWSQSVALERGRGRVVALAEAAMLSAQREATGGVTRERRGGRPRARRRRSSIPASAPASRDRRRPR